MSSVTNKSEHTATPSNKPYSSSLLTFADMTGTFAETTGTFDNPISFQNKEANTGSVTNKASS